jgi:hypothetical protein
MSGNVGQSAFCLLRVASKKICEIELAKQLVVVVVVHSLADDRR